MSGHITQYITVHRQAILIFFFLFESFQSYKIIHRDWRTHGRYAGSWLNPEVIPRTLDILSYSGPIYLVYYSLWGDPFVLLSPLPFTSQDYSSSYRITLWEKVTQAWILSPRSSKKKQRLPKECRGMYMYQAYNARQMLNVLKNKQKCKPLFLSNFQPMICVTRSWYD